MHEVNWFLGLLDKYGLGTDQLALTGYLFWKLFTNHLAHIQKAIEDNNDALQSLKKDTDEIKKDMTVTKQRVATIEGRCSAFHKEK